MSQPKEKQLRVLAIAPSTRGLGFAVMEGKSTLVDWGLKAVNADKNARSLSNVANLIGIYNPTIIVLEDAHSKSSRRSSRIQALVSSIVELADDEGIPVKLLARTKVRTALLLNPRGTIHELAESVANRFPAELGLRLPKKRKPWMSEDSRMDIFRAVALAQCVFTFDRSISTGP